MRVGLDDQDYSIGKMVKTSGKTGYTRIGSEHVGAGGWSVSGRGTARRKAWGDGQVVLCDTQKCLGAPSFVTMGKLRQIRPGKSDHEYFCLSC